MAVIEVKHPLVKHKIGLMREGDMSTKKFRELTGEVARLLAYEATADFPLEKTTIAGWCGEVEIDQIAGRKVTVVPILRAGLGMLPGVLALNRATPRSLARAEAFFGRLSLPVLACRAVDPSEVRQTLAAALVEILDTMDDDLPYDEPPCDGVRSLDLSGLPGRPR